MADGLGGGGDGARVDGGEPGEVGDGELRVGEQRAGGVPGGPALDQSVPAVPLGLARPCGQQGDRGDDRMSALVVALGGGAPGGASAWTPRLMARPETLSIIRPLWIRGAKAFSTLSRTSCRLGSVTSQDEPWSRVKRRPSPSSSTQP
ncbi:hypothetical protein GCM10020000_23460 [Streptomyces olivoverticillatus]